MKLIGDKLAEAQTKSAKSRLILLLHKIKGSEHRRFYSSYRKFTENSNVNNKHLEELNRFYDKNPEYLI